MNSVPAHKGTLEKIRFPEALIRIASLKETGVLKISHHHIEKKIYFQEGNVIFSQSNDLDDRLGPLLLRQKKIAYRQLSDCEPKVAPGNRLGTILVLEGYIQPDDLVRGVTDQVKEIIYSLFDWEEGTYEFISGPLPTTEIITLNLSIPDLVFNGMGRIRRWSWIRRSVGDLDEVFRKRAGWTTVVRKMNVPTEVEALLDLFDRPRTLEEILKLSTAGDFEACKVIWFFLISGIIEKILQSPQWDDSDEDLKILEEPNSASLQPAVAAASEMSDGVSGKPAENTGRIVSGEFAEPASPTLKIDLPNAQIESQADQSDNPNTASMPVQELPKHLLPELPPLPLIHAEHLSTSNVELSFADLADLTDSAEELAPVAEAVEKPVVKQPDIQQHLRAFNDLHHYIFELVRLDIGPGAQNFIAKTLKKATAKFPLLFEGVPMDEFGELDAGSLRINIEGNLLDNYREGLDYLLEEERSEIRMFLEPKRVEVIEAGLKRMMERQKSIAG